MTSLVQIGKDVTHSGGFSLPWIPLAALAVAGILLDCGAVSAQTIAPQIIEIPAGPFIMGSDSGAADERPAHTVHLRAFSIDRLPVTNAQFAEFLNSAGLTGPRGEKLYDHDDPDARIHRRGNRWIADPGAEQHPVVEASWAGAQAYCERRNARLPTEAEWEKSARGNDGRRFPWGNQAPDARRARFGAGWHDTAPVDAHPAGASPYGVLDMAGNAWEWVSSVYRPYPYNPDDGREDLTPGPVRSTRGGGQDSPADEITTTQRGRNLSRNPAAGHHNIGFRCAR